jgi:hypothetical protein
VHKATEGRQTPWESSSLTSDFAFFGSPSAKVASGAATLPNAIGTAARASKPAVFWRKELQGRSPQDAFEFVILQDDVDAYEDFLSLHAATAFAPRVRGLLERRREMMTWYTAVTVNTVLAYQAFLDRYPNSDLVPTARRMRDRTQARAQSANLARGFPGLGNAPPPAPAVIPASLPAAPAACSCPVPAKRAEPTPPPRRPGPPPRGSRPPVIEEEEVIIRRPPPRVVGPGIDIVIGPNRRPPPRYIPPPTTCRGTHCKQFR